MNESLCALRDELCEVLRQQSADNASVGPYVNSRQIANRLVQEAISGTNPIAAVASIVAILQIRDAV